MEPVKYPEVMFLCEHIIYLCEWVIHVCKLVIYLYKRATYLGLGLFLKVKACWIQITCWQKWATCEHKYYNLYDLLTQVNNLVALTNNSFTHVNNLRKQTTNSFVEVNISFVQMNKSPQMDNSFAQITYSQI